MKIDHVGQWYIAKIMVGKELCSYMTLFVPCTTQMTSMEPLKVHRTKGNLAFDNTSINNWLQWTERLQPLFWPIPQPAPTFKGVVKIISEIAVTSWSRGDLAMIYGSAQCFDLTVTALPSCDISGVLVISPPPSILEMTARSPLDHLSITAQSPLPYCSILYRLSHSLPEVTERW